MEKVKMGSSACSVINFLFTVTSMKLKFGALCTVGMQGVTKKCRLSWLSIDQNSALIYEPKCGGRGLLCGVSANEYSYAHGAQINFGDLTPYLNYAS
jgi:hypothetical protein